VEEIILKENFDVVALGELLIDFTPQKGEPGKVCYEMNPGGAPANVLVMLEKLGKSTALIGKVGDDIFGRFLKSTVEAEKINSDGIIVSREQSTTLAFVNLDESGNRSFAFLRKKSADVMLGKDEVDTDLIDCGRVFHFGSVSMTAEPARSATIFAAEYAKSKGKLISIDPNYRPLLWDDEQSAIAQMRSMLDIADIIKISDNELELIYGEKDYIKGAQRLIENGASFAFVTAGADGCYYAAKNGERGHVPGFSAKVVDTTGAGDTFCGAALSCLLECNFAPKPGMLEKIVRFANAAGALNTTKRGAIPAMPTRAEVEQLSGEYA
jgi:fructokinase